MASYHLPVVFFYVFYSFIWLFQLSLLSLFSNNYASSLMPSIFRSVSHLGMWFHACLCFFPFLWFIFLIPLSRARKQALFSLITYLNIFFLIFSHLFQIYPPWYLESPPLESGFWAFGTEFWNQPLVMIWPICWCDRAQIKESLRSFCGAIGCDKSESTPYRSILGSFFQSMNCKHLHLFLW